MKNKVQTENKVTLKDVLGYVIRDLSNICIPSFLLELPPDKVFAIKQTLIDPIASAKSNLRECVIAIEREEQKKNVQEQPKEPENIIDLGELTEETDDA